jgi:hypothetical protein
MRLDPLGQQLGKRTDKLALLLARHRLRGARQHAQRELSARLGQAPAPGDACCCLSVRRCQLSWCRRRVGSRR